MRLAQGGKLGANAGTTLIVQLLSFDVAEIAPALILIGVLMFRSASAGPHDFGRVLIWLGLLLMALLQQFDVRCGSTSEVIQSRDHVRIPSNIKTSKPTLRGGLVVLKDKTARMSAMSLWRSLH